MTDQPEKTFKYIERDPEKFLERYFPEHAFEQALADARFLEPDALIEHLLSGPSLSADQREELAEFLATRLKYLPEGRGPGVRAEKHRQVAIEAKARRKADKSKSVLKHSEDIVQERHAADNLNLETILDLIEGSTKRLYPKSRD